MNEIPWATVYGYGAVIKSTKNTLIITQNGKTTYYPLDELRHLVISGGHTLQTETITRLSEHNIPITFFSPRGEVLGTLPGSNEPALKNRQKAVAAQKFSLAIINASINARMLLLHEISEKMPGGIFYKGELEILTKMQDELQYLVTMQEFWRVFSLNRNMYYEILSRAVPKNTNYHRLAAPPYTDPLNVLFSLGYAVLYADAAMACTGAGLDISCGTLFGSVEPCKTGACVYDLIEGAKPAMVDRVVLGLAEEGALENNFETNGRCILSDELVTEFYARLSRSVSREVLEANVKMYADSVRGITEPAFRY